MTEQFADDGEFFGTTPSAPVASDGAVAGVAGGFVLNLTEDDLTDGVFAEIPVGTWLRLAFYEVEPAMVTSQKNYGKPKYTASFVNTEETVEWGKRRKFPFITMCLFEGAFFTTYPILKAVGMEPTKETLAKGAFFDAAYMEEFPDELAKLVAEGGIFTESKRIPKGAYVFPSPKQLAGKELCAKVSHYGVSGDFKARYTSQAKAQEDGHVRAFAVLGEYHSVAEHQDLMAKAQGTGHNFKGDE
jgi:hypothetical protein